MKDSTNIFKFNINRCVFEPVRDNQRGDFVLATLDFLVYSDSSTSIRDATDTIENAGIRIGKYLI